MKTFYVHCIAALCLLSGGAQSTSADTLIFDNSQLTGYVFQLPANTEVLDYGTSEGGTLSTFAFAYTAGTSATVRVRFYEGTDNAACGSLVQEFDIPVSATVGTGICEYVISAENRFDLPAGNFGYSFETAASSFRVEMCTGGAGTNGYYWQQEPGGGFRSYLLDPPYSLSFQLYSGPPLDQLLCDITGVKFNDLNGDGIRDTEEPALAGWEFYLDANNDGIRQTTEPLRVTDSEGVFVFEDLTSPGTYRLREVLPEGWLQTVPGAAEDFCYLIDTEPGSVYGPFAFGNRLPLKYDGGDGSSEQPYRIRTPEHLVELSASPDDWNGHFILVADLDMTGIEHTPIGYFNSAIDRKYFTGVFNGNHHVIRNLVCTRTTPVNYTGLFGYASNAHIYDLGLENATVTSAGGCVGALVGCCANGSIERCFVTGHVQAVQQGYYFGGLAGLLEGTPVTDCRSDVDVCVTTVAGGSYTGGLAGLAWSLTNCYSSGLVIGAAGSSCTGGLVGNEPAAVSSYWDVQASGQTAGGGIPRTTAQMRTMSLFVYWDFENTWRICDGMNYPRLKWEPLPVGDFTCPEGVELTDFAVMADQWLMTGPSDADIAPAGAPDGRVDLHDMALLAVHWMEGTE